MGTRILLLLSIAWVMRLTAPLFTSWQAFSGRDLILIGGGLFLLWKSVHEIHGALEGDEEATARRAAGWRATAASSSRSPSSTSSSRSTR